MLMIPPHGDGGRRLLLLLGLGNMNQPLQGAVCAGAVSVGPGAQVEVEDGAVPWRAPLVSWEGGVDAIVC